MFKDKDTGTEKEQLGAIALPSTFRFNRIK